MGDELNKFENRLRTKMTLDREGGRTSAEMLKFSVNRNVIVEVVTPEPSYIYTFTQSSPSVDDSPAVTEPDGARKWDLKGFMSMSGYVSFTGGTSPTVDLEMWAYDTTNNLWFLVGAVSGASEATEFEFDGKAKQRTVFIRVSAVSGSPTALTVNMTAE